jgi:hypothetical protein
MLPLAIIADRTRRAAVGAMLLIGAVLAGYVYFTSLYLQKVDGFSPPQTGLALVPSTITVVLVSTMLTRRLLTTYSIKQVLIAGLTAMAGGQLWLAQIHAGASRPARRPGSRCSLRWPRRAQSTPPAPLSPAAGSPSWSRRASPC